MPIYNTIDPNYPTSNLVFNYPETPMQIAQIPYSYSNGHIDISLSDGISKNAWFQYEKDGSTISLTHSNNQNGLITEPTLTLSNNVLTATTYMVPEKSYSNVTVTSTGDEPKVVVSAEVHATLGYTVYMHTPDDNQILTNPSDAFSNGTYNYQFRLLDCEGSYWKITANKTLRTNDRINLYDLIEITYKINGESESVVSGADLVSYFPTWVVTTSNGQTVDYWKKAPSAFKTVVTTNEHT